MLASLTIKDLPSHYRPYPKPFKVRVEPFRVRDVEALASIEDPIDQIEYLLRGITLERRGGILVDPKELVSMDFFYIGVSRMLASGFNELKLRAMCPEGHVHSYVIPMTQVDFYELEVDVPVYIEIDDPKIHEIILMPDTIARVLEAREAGLFDEGNPIKMLALTLVAYKDSKGERHDLSVEEAIKVLEALPASVLDPLDYYAAGLTARIKPFKLKCKTCGGEFETAPVGNLLDMIKPFRSPEGAPRVKVRFGD